MATTRSKRNRPISGCRSVCAAESYASLRFDGGRSLASRRRASDWRSCFPEGAMRSKTRRRRHKQTSDRTATTRRRRSQALATDSGVGGAATARITRLAAAQSGQAEQLGRSSGSACLRAAGALGQHQSTIRLFDPRADRAEARPPTCMCVCDTIRYDTRCYFNVRSTADISRLNLPHGNDN